MIVNKFYWLCPYCLKTETTSRNWSLMNLSHTHYPGRDIPQKGWINVSSMSSGLWRFDTIAQRNEKRRELILREKAKCSI